VATQRNATQRNRLAGWLAGWLADVSITHLTFSREYTNAVEAKQVAQQEAERAKYVVMKANQEKEAIIIKAEGEAQSAALVGKAIKENPAFIKLRKIDAARDIANVVSNSGQRVYLSADSLLLNVAEDDGKNAQGKKR
jgi:prohibitin 2